MPALQTKISIGENSSALSNKFSTSLRSAKLQGMQEILWASSN